MATGAIGLVLTLGLGAYSALAATPSHPAVTGHKLTTGDFSILIGPLTAKDGFKVEIEAIDCGTKHAGVVVNYEKGNDTIALDHSYGRAGGTCTVLKTLRAATLKVRWGAALDLDLELATTRKLIKVKSDICKGSYDEYRPAKTTGTGLLAIHSQAFGTLRATRDAARVIAVVSSGTCNSTGSSAGTTGGVMPINGRTGGFLQARGADALARAAVTGLSRAGFAAPTAPRSTHPESATAATATTPTTTTVSTTPTPAPTTTPTTTTAPATTPPPTITSDGSGTQFLGVFGASGNLVVSAATEAPDKPLVIINDYATDVPAPGVEGSMDVAEESTQAFTVAAGDTGAQVSTAAAFARGTLVFTPTALCHSITDALDGTLAGSIVVRDPVFGTLTFNGPRAVGAALGNGDAHLDSC